MEAVVLEQSTRCGNQNGDALPVVTCDARGRKRGGEGMGRRKKRGRGDWGRREESGRGRGKREERRGRKEKQGMMMIRPAHGHRN